jgi:diguanylate cyclase (GGDEF)-like protein
MNDDNNDLKKGFEKTDLEWVERNDPLYLDDLTDAYNRVAYDVFMPRLVDEARTLKIPLTLVMLDLDGFKLVNETYGYKKGDEKIAEVAEKLRPHIRQTDYLFRFIGDVFILAFRDSDADGVAEIMIPRIRRSMEEIGLNVSVGTAELKAEDNVKSLFERAEEMMRKEKLEKKNV